MSAGGPPHSAGARDAATIGYLPSYTVNMALAVTPDDPGSQLAHLAPPIWIGLAGADELLDGARTAAFVKRHAPAATIEIVPGATHLGILLDAAPAVAAALHRFGLPEAAPA